MNAESEVLKIIFQGKTKIHSISNSLEFGTEYIRLICRSLARRDLIRAIKRDWYKVSPKGKRALEVRGLLRRRRAGRRGLKMKNSIWQVVKMKDYNPPTALYKPSRNIKLKSMFKESKEEKLKLGTMIEKVASFLGKLKASKYE